MIPSRSGRAILLASVLLSSLCLAAPAPGEVDESFVVGSGFSLDVVAVAADFHGRVLCGGRFQNYQGQPTPYLARLRPDGSLDLAFSEMPRPDAPVQFVVPLADGRILIGGAFLKVGDVARHHLAWLLADGALDTSVTADVEGDLTALVPLPRDRVLVAGSFTTFAGQPRRYLARLGIADGVLDPGFVPGAGLSSVPTSAAWLPGDQLLLDARWVDPVPTNSRSYFFRMNPDGQADPTFSSVNLFGMQPQIQPLQDGSILVCRAYLDVLRIFRDGPVDPDWGARPPAGRNPRLLGTLRDGRILYHVQPPAVGTSPSALHRLFADGTDDPTFQVSLEAIADSHAWCAWEMADGRLIVGGSFASVNGQASQNLVVLHGNSMDAPPRVRWNGGTFAAEERAGVARASLLRQGRLEQAATVRVVTAPGTAGETTDFQPLVADLTFAPGESLKLVDVVLVDDAEPEADEAFELRMEGDLVEPSAATARVIILSDEGLYGFAESSSRVNELAGTWELRMSRQGGAPYPAEVQASGRPGSAGTNDCALLPVTCRFAAGSRTATASIAIFDDPDVEGPESVTWELGPVPTGSRPAPPLEHTLTILDNDQPGAPGEGLDSPAKLLETDKNRVFLSGKFTTVHGDQEPGLARLRWDGRPETSFEAPALEGVGRPLGTMADGRIYTSWLVASPTIPPHLRKGYLARLLPDGRVDPTFTATNRFADSVGRQGVVLSDGSLVVDQFKLGSWSQVQEMMKVDASGVFVPAFASNSFGFHYLGSLTRSVVLGAQRGGSFLVGGQVYVPRGAFGPTYSPLREDLLRLYVTGEADTNFHCRLEGPTTAQMVLGFAVAPDDRIYVQGQFRTVDGVPRPGLALLLPDGGLDPSFSPPDGLVPSSGLRSLAMAVQPDGRLLLLRPPPDGLIRLRLDGTADDAFGPVSVSGGDIEAVIALRDGPILLSGTFSAINGLTRWRLAWLDADGRLLPDQPLRLTLAMPAPADTIVLSVESRLAGRLQLDRTVTDWQWQGIGTFDILPGSTRLYSESTDQAAAQFRAQLSGGVGPQ